MTSGLCANACGRNGRLCFQEYIKGSGPDNDIVRLYICPQCKSTENRLRTILNKKAGRTVFKKIEYVNFLSDDEIKKHHREGGE